MVPTLYLFDRFDERLGILPAVGGITHVEETAATASDTVASYEDLGSEEF